MDDELPMARKEKEGRPVLLASEPDGATISRPIHRDKRKKSLIPPRKRKERKAKNTENKSKGSSKTKGTDASSPEPEGHRRANKDRKSDRGDEGKDTGPRRSAQELGITYPTECMDSKPHYWVGRERVHHGTLFRCKICHKHLWLPTDAGRLSDLIQKYGSNEGYCKFLNISSSRGAKVLMAKIQDLERLRESSSDNLELARVAARILDRKEYDKNEHSD